ncbi:MAG: hypothetical protein DCC52_16595 [Chloroflexi bacterium]|nr:MAG: hypothetical protein DCC52_16595 [Chloroflexota bacterium]
MRRARHSFAENARPRAICQRAQIEAIRGVNCDGVVHTLLARNLIEAVGELETVGHPTIYGTTFDFLQYFGLTSLEQLPPLPDNMIPVLPALLTETETETTRAANENTSVLTAGAENASDADAAVVCENKADPADARAAETDLADADGDALTYLL